MIDRDVLSKSFKVTRVICLFYPLIMVMYGLVAWVLFANSSSVADGPGSGQIETTRLVLFAVVALSPVAIAPLLRLLLSRTRIRAARDPQSVAMKPEFIITSHVQAEYGIWSLTSTLGFVAFFLGATWTLFFAALAVNLMGYVASYPRWSRAVAYADEYDAAAAASVAAVPAH